MAVFLRSIFLRNGARQQASDVARENAGIPENDATESFKRLRRRFYRSMCWEEMQRTMRAVNSARMRDADYLGEFP